MPGAADNFHRWTPATFAKKQHVALLRLQLKLTADIHLLLDLVYRRLRDKLLDLTAADGLLPPYTAGSANSAAAEAWRNALTLIEARFQRARVQAALISFALLPYDHHRLFSSIEESSLPQTPLNEVGGPNLLLGLDPLLFFRPQLAEVIDATAERIYSDGFKLSDRIWNLDQDSLTGIQRLVSRAIATGNSAWNIAPQLEQFLGANSDCPRWTRDRLFKLTKTDIAAGNRTGLISGSPCSGAGVSYNALRLIRNEIQIVHAAATDKILSRLPWVQAEKINLSPSHPPIGCRCEDIVAGGDNQDGVYPLGTITLPIHVQCLCYKTPVSMPDDQFTSRLRGWMTGQEKWPGLDAYAAWTGATAKTIATGDLLKKLYTQLALPMITWLDGTESDLDDLLGGPLE